eukprot:jgi/Hompol1/392/HPOL_002974-RA
MEYDHATHTITFRYSQINSFLSVFLSEFRHVGSMLRLMYQLMRYKESLIGMGAVATLPDLHSVAVAWRGSTILRVDWQTTGPESALQSPQQSKGRYVVTFQREDGQPDEHSILAEMSSALLNRTRFIIPLIVTLNRISRLASSLERIRSRRAALGQTSVTLEVISFTHYRLAFMQANQPSAFEFVFSPPNSFVMYDASMADLTTDLHLGIAQKTHESTRASNVAPVAGGVRQYKQLSEFFDVPAIPAANPGEVGRPARPGMLSAIAARVTPASQQQSAHAHQNANDPSNDADQGALLLLPYGIVANLSLIDTVMYSVEAYIDISYSMETALAFVSQKNLKDVSINIDPNQNFLLIRAPKIRCGIVGSSTGKWSYGALLRDANTEGRPTPQQIQDCKALNDKINAAINSQPFTMRNSVQWLLFGVQLILLPEQLFREIMLLHRVDTVKSPPQNANSELLPIRYNVTTGAIAIWQPDNQYDMTHLHTGTAEFISMSEKLKAMSNQQIVPLPHKPFVQASVRVIASSQGGPGKLFPVLKHMTTRTLAEIRGETKP